MKILVAGDFCEQGRIKDEIVKGDFSILFDKVKPIVQDAQFSVVNFEFPIVQGNGSPIAKAGPDLLGGAESIEALRYAGFNVCTLANNHILDQGEQCCIATKHLLEENGIKTVGAGKNLDGAGSILYLRYSDEILAVINCCEHEFSIATESSAGANPLNPIRQFYKIQEARRHADHVLVIVHGGHEHCQLPSPRMKETYHFFVDAGADAVVNHHQHCYSGYEQYKGKPIFYGLGNFLFDRDGVRNKPWNEGFMVTLDFSKTDNPHFTIYPYIQCNDDPTVQPMDGEGRARFDKRIEELNHIIEDDQLLEQEWHKWMEKDSSYFLLSFQPYNNRITKALYTRGLLPSFITKEKRLGIINHIECESHLDRLRYIVRKLKL